MPVQLDLALQRALTHLENVQKPNGAWAGEVVWNSMLACQFVILHRILDRPIDPIRARRIRLSLELQVLPDGGWGMHREAPSWLFHTTLAFVALRILGHAPTDPLVANAHRWIVAHGGPRKLPAWGRIWLALLGLYPWDGVRPIPPELWLTPHASPSHPRRLYCHMRLIYLGLSTLYGLRHTAPMDRELQGIRDELWPEGFAAARRARPSDDISRTDLFEPPGAALRWVYRFGNIAERCTPQRLRRRAIERALLHIQFELRSTGFVCLSPVNGMLFCLALHAIDPGHPDLDCALKGLEYWVWEDDHGGFRVAGARSDIWDTSFVLQALCEVPENLMAKRLARRACEWLPIAQLRADIPGGAAHHRAEAQGGWGFADEHHPWPVSDCTAEALEALIGAEALGVSGNPLPSAAKRAAVEFILLRQNDDGGFGSYEARRGTKMLIHFNPTEIFGNCMLEYSYAECTASCVRGLAVAAKAVDLEPALRTRVDAAITSGSRFLLSVQDPSGAWAGFWGVNFTYGTFFAVHGLLAAGMDPEHEAIRRAVRWLLAHQRPDGGWGESWEGNLDGRDVAIPADEPSVIGQTAWAILTLQKAAPQRGHDAIERGLTYLIGRQQADGSWPEDRATGVFFNTAVLDYRLYRQIFPTWALARASAADARHPTR